MVSDCCTKYTLLFTLRSATSDLVRKHIEKNVLLVYGVPQFLICDNCRILFNVYYHKQANPAERVNRTLKTMIRSYVGDNNRTWDKQLSRLGFALRTAVHEVTGYSAAYINFGRELPISEKQHPVDGQNPRVPFEFADRGRLAKHVEELHNVCEDVRSRLDKVYVLFS